MKKLTILRTLLFTFAASMLTGCFGGAFAPVKDPTVFYKLNAKDQPSVASEEAPGISFAIMPISLPPYFNRAQIVTLDGGNRVTEAEFNRWIEMPSDTMPRIFMENLSTLCKNSNVYAYPVVAYEESNLWVRIYVYDCIGTLGQNLSFKARWQLIATDGKHELVSRDFVKKYPVKADYDSYVAAIEQACADLSLQIANGIKEYSAKTAKTPAAKQ